MILLQSKLKTPKVIQIYRIKTKQSGLLNQLLHLGKKEQSAPQLELNKEIVLTQASQVAYHLRQEHRAFDTASMFELLTNEFVQRKTCIKAPFDLSKKAIDEIDPNIFKFEKKAQMV